LSDPKPSVVADPAVQNIIRRKARKLSRLTGFHIQDEEDLANALVVGLLQRCCTLSPGHAYSFAFLTRLINQVAANLIRDRYASKRDDRRVRSLNTFVRADVEDQFVELAAAITQENADARTGNHTRNPQEQAQLQADVQALLKSLPPDAHDLAERLMADSLADVARAARLPRTTLQSRKKQLREVFERENLRDYL